MLKNIKLRLFDADDGGGNGGGEQTPPTPNTDQTPPTPASGADTIDTEKVAAEARASFLKDLGVDDADTLKDIIKSHNEQVTANQTKLEAAQTNLDKTAKTLSKETARADTAEAQLAAMKAGVDEAHLNDALALANADLAAKANGVKTIADALTSVLERNPSFKGGAESQGTAIAGANLGGGNSNVAVPDLTKIGYSEAAKLKADHPNVYQQALQNLSK